MEARHVMLLTLCPLIVLGNAFLLLGLLLAHHRGPGAQEGSLPSPLTFTRHLLFNLALVEILIGGIILPLVVVAESRSVDEHPSLCLVSICFTLAAISVTSFLLIAVGIERYLAVLKPLRYACLVTYRRVVVAAVLCWLAGVLLGLAPLAGWNNLQGWRGQVCNYTDHNHSVAVREEEQGNTGVHVNPSVVIVKKSYQGTYTLTHQYSHPHTTESTIAETAPRGGGDTKAQADFHRQCKFTVVLPGSFAGLFFVGLNVPLWLGLLFLYGRILLEAQRQQALHHHTPTPSSSSSQQRLSTSIIRVNYKAIRLISAIVGLFFFSWGPVSVYYAVLFEGFSREVLCEQVLLPEWSYVLVTCLLYGASAVNPWVYGFGDRTIREAWARTRLGQALGGRLGRCRAKVGPADQGQIEYIVQGRGRQGCPSLQG